MKVADAHEVYFPSFCRSTTDLVPLDKIYCIYIEIEEHS